MSTSVLTAVGRFLRGQRGRRRQSLRTTARRGRLESLEPRLVLAAPVAANDGYAMLEGRSLSVGAPGLLGNDFDPDGDPIRPVVASNPANGSLAVSDDGSFAYTPNAGFTGRDSFTYRVIDDPGSVLFTVDRSRSNVNIQARLTTSFGSSTDSDTSSLTGTVRAALTPNVAPFSQIHITDLELFLADGMQLRFRYGCTFLGCIAGVNVDAQPNDVRILMEQPGPPAAVAAGSFLQPNNELRLTGTIYLQGTGLAAGQVPEGPQPFDTAGAFTDFNGTVSQSGQTITLTLPINYTGTFDDGTGNTVDVTITGTMVATGAPAAAPALSNVATVTIDVDPQISARPDTYRVREDALLTVPSVPTVVDELVLPAGSIWRYLDNGTDQGTAWRAAGFSDSAWASGPAVLGYGQTGLATTIAFGPDSANKYVTTYFRRAIDIPQVHDISDLLIDLRRDDGAAVYVNGVEVIRDGLAPNAAFNTLATLAADNGAQFHPFIVPASMLVPGRNVIAVEVHQTTLNSSDVIFDMAVRVRRQQRSVLANDVDRLGNPLYAALLREPRSGGVLLDPDGTFFYQPNANFAGTDTFQYVAGNFPLEVFVPRGAVWKYRDDGSNQGTAWRQLAFDDSGWKSGPAELGYGDGDEATLIHCGPSAPACNAGNHLTTYFRHAFQVSNPAQFTSPLVLNVIRDDGMAVYLNGVEIARNNLPAGAAFNTPASGTVGGVDESTPLRYVIDPALLRDGVNVIAAEVHQAAITSSDVSFDLWLTSGPVSAAGTVTIIVEPVADPPRAANVGPYQATPGEMLTVGAAAGVLAGANSIETGPIQAQVVSGPGRGNLVLRPDGSFDYTPISAGSDSFSFRAVQQATLVPMGATWRYLDDGSDQAAAWRTPGFNDAGWAVGPGELGYGDGDERTLIRYGSSSSNRHVTTYFRREFLVDDPAAWASLTLRVIRDDGVAVFLNGMEIARDNLAAGAAFDTLANVAIGGVDETTPIVFAVNPALLVPGRNVLAVEMHQNARTSSDLSFNLELAGQIGSPAYTASLEMGSTQGPMVRGVHLAGSAWNAGFAATLGAHGYAVPAGPGQMAPLPWLGVNRVTVVFSEPVTNLPAQVSLVGQQGGAVGTTSLETANQADGSFAATWQLSAPLGADRYTLTLPESITNTAGAALDGEWQDAGSSFPSGNGTAGGAFSMRVSVLPGDVTRDGNVDGADAAANTAGMFQRLGTSGYSVVADLNGDGRITVADRIALRDRMSSALPAAAAGAEAFDGGPIAAPASSSRAAASAASASSSGVDQLLATSTVIRTIESYGGRDGSPDVQTYRWVEVSGTVSPRLRAALEGAAWQTAKDRLTTLRSRGAAMLTAAIDRLLSAGG